MARDEEGTHSWLVDAQAEHASVASFARATLELMAVGAPADLLGDTQRAALDEVRHATQCFSLARAYGATTASAGPLPVVAPRVLDLAGLAHATFIEGCVGETASALVATRAAAACTDPVVKAILEQIAEDEARHAALAWRIVQWTLRTGGDEVARELVAARAAVETGRVHHDVDATLVDRPARGRLGPAQVRAATRDAWQQIGRPILDTLLA